MIKTKMYALRWYDEDGIKQEIEDLKKDGFKVKTTGGNAFGELEIEINIKIESKTIKTFINKVEKVINKMDGLGFENYSLMNKKEVILTEEADFSKIRDLFFISDDEFLESYSYIMGYEIDFDKARVFDFIKGVLK